ncbi:MAG TPA: hypothetical protein VFW69_01375 [Mycobacterium sp.]|nr:hypothetical protein [Mycobacterium sp.]
MNAEYIVYAFVGEVIFAAMAAGALLTLATLLKVVPAKVLRGKLAGSRRHTQISAIECTDRRLEHKEPVMAGMQTSAMEHPDEAVAYPTCG